MPSGEVDPIGHPAVRVLAVDPGYEQSAWVLYDGATVLEHQTDANTVLLSLFNAGLIQCEAVVFEAIESFGMAVGREVFETVFWTGRLFEAASSCLLPSRVERLPRKAVKVHLCQSARAQDSNIRVALIDRFGGTERAKGTKRAPGPLHGITKHEWSALAIAVTWWDQHGQEAVRHDG